MKKKRLFRVFLVWQEEKEEAWLNIMAEKGWFLKKYNFFYYEFENRQPSKVIYKLDFQTNIQDLPAYKKIFEEFGWEYVTSFVNWHYFRGEKEKVYTEEIYTDKISITQKYAKMEKALTIGAAGLLLLTVSNLLITFLVQPVSDFTVISVLFSFSTFLLLLYCIVKIKLKIKAVN